MTWARPGFEKVLAFFDGDVRKAHAWYTTPNPHWGDYTPARVIALGMGHKVERMIDEAERAEKAGTMHAENVR